jgi:NhaP-type Na+/H+ or K+/H+ antiporter
MALVILGCASVQLGSARSAAAQDEVLYLLQTSVETAQDGWDAEFDDGAPLAEEYDVYGSSEDGVQIDRRGQVLAKGAPTLLSEEAFYQDFPVDDQDADGARASQPAGRAAQPLQGASGTPLPGAAEPVSSGGPDPAGSAGSGGAGGSVASGIAPPAYDSVSPPVAAAPFGGPLGDEEANTKQHASGQDAPEQDTVAEHQNASGMMPGQSKGYLCLAWLLVCLVTGCILQVYQERLLPRVPYTCLLFLAGFAMAAVNQLRPYCHWSLWPTWFISVEMWDMVDPHMIFHVFLPPLIFAEAMRLNLKMAMDVSGQVLVLACPGVLLGAATIASFSRYVFPYDWSWPTSLVFGAILSATDPVAVVALFNTLGVSQRLTMLVSGESLVNDGTAIVMFSLFLKIMLGATVSYSGLVFFVLNMTVTPILLGTSIAFGFLIIIAWCSESSYYTDAMIQVILTICCAFFCFFIAETQCSTSGVLTLVSAGCIFSYVAWPRFVSREVIKTVWEALEFIGNTVVFTLAGMLWGIRVMNRVEHLELVDVGWLFLLYLAATATRAAVVVIFWPVLNMCGQEITWQESVVVVWAGLRGAVGLVLAIVMDLQPKVDKRIGSQVMFHVGGMALLTICINGTTTPWLLRRLGLTKAPEVEEQVTKHLHKLTGEHVKGHFDEIMDKREDLRFVGANVDTVRTMVPDIAGEIPTQTCGAVSAGVKLQVYRETFLRAVQQHYWEAIEGGVIPRTSRVARVMLYSADVALSNSKEPLRDWEVVADNLSDHQYFPRMNRICETWPLTLIPPLQQLFPSSMTIMMWRVYASVSFLEAHQAVQEELQTIFGADSVLGKQIQQELARESKVQCGMAEELQKSLPSEAVEVGKSRMLSGRLLQLQLEEVLRLRTDGMLNEKSADKISQCIHESRRNVAGVRRHARS